MLYNHNQLQNAEGNLLHTQHSYTLIIKYAEYFRFGIYHSWIECNNCACTKPTRFLKCKTGHL